MCELFNIFWCFSCLEIKTGLADVAIQGSSLRVEREGFGLEVAARFSASPDPLLLTYGQSQHLRKCYPGPEKHRKRRKTFLF